MTISNNLVVSCFGGSKLRNIMTKFVRKVIVSLHELVIMETTLAYDLLDRKSVV